MRFALPITENAHPPQHPSDDRLRARAGEMKPSELSNLRASCVPA